MRLAPVERTASTASFRPDVDALRAVAIVLVVLYHARVPGFRGGFVGVDVFFVISGFLITRNLLAEHASSGRIAMGGFCGRRLRRLVPAMSVMVPVTLVAGVVVLTPLRWDELASDALAASLYYANHHFAANANDYFGSGVRTSPLLHTWSLAVEVQFYLLWPLVVAGALALGRRMRRSRSALVTALAVATIGSFALSIHLVAAGDPLGFYGLPSRAWEFAVAGLLAVATTRLRWGLRPAPAIAVAVAGLVTIVFAAHTYGDSTPFPGTAAALPVAGTLAIIAAGSWSTATGPAAVSPLRWLGRVSYAWYLWHWPAMVLTVAWFGNDSTELRLAAGLGALGAAELSRRYVEEPVLQAPLLAHSGWATTGMVAGCTALALAFAAGVAVYTDQVQEDSFHRDIAAAANKDYLDACRWSTDRHGNEVCALGATDARRTVVVSGDSHAMSWAPGFDGAGKALGMRVLVRAANSCPGAPVATMSEHTGRVNQSCLDYRDGTRQLIEDARPELVVVVSSDFTRRVAGPDGTRIASRSERLAVWSGALTVMRAELAREGTTLGAILDNPRITPDPLICMEERRNLDACSPTRAQATARVQGHVRNELEALGPDATMSTIDLICNDRRCPIRSGDGYVWADSTHLSSGFTRAHADEVEAFLRRLIAQE